MHEIKCNVCGDGVFILKEKVKSFSHNGEAESLKMLSFECNVCNSSYTTAAQSKVNKRTVTAFKKRADGLLSGREIRVIRERLNISQSEASAYFGGGPVAFSKYETDDVTQSEAMDNLLRVAYAHPEVVIFLKARAEGQYTSIDSLLIKPVRDSRLNVEHHITQFFSFFIKEEPLAETWRTEKDVIENSIVTSNSQLAAYIADVGKRVKKAEGYISDNIPQRRVEDKASILTQSTGTNWNKTSCLH